MNNMEYTKKVTDLYHESLLNLSRSIQDAGGCVDLLDKDMTIQELLLACSTNSVIISAKHCPQEKQTKEQEALAEIVRHSNLEYNWENNSKKRT